MGKVEMEAIDYDVFALCHWSLFCPSPHCVPKHRVSDKLLSSVYWLFSPIYGLLKPLSSVSHYFLMPTAYASSRSSLLSILFSSYKYNDPAETMSLCTNSMPFSIFSSNAAFPMVFAAVTICLNISSKRLNILIKEPS